MRSWILLVLAAFTPSLAGCDAIKNLTGKKSEAASADESEEDEAPKKKKKKKKDDDEAKDDDAKTDKPKTGGPPLDAFVEKHLGLAATAAKCGTPGAVEPWCTAAKGFAQGESAMPGVGTKLGLTTFIVTKDATLDTIAKYRHPSALAFRKDGASAFAWISEVKGSNPAEVADLDKVSRGLLDRFAGKNSDLGVKPDLATYLDGLPAQAKYPLQAHGGGFTIQGGSFADVRRVGATWVAVEVPRKDPAGIYFSVFSEAAYR